MTNAEKYLKNPDNYHDFACEIAIHMSNSIKNGTVQNIDDFFKKQVKLTLSEDEKVILRNIEFKDYMVIGRKESGDLYVNDKEKDSFNGTWFIMFKKHLFQFIEPRRRI